MIRRSRSIAPTLALVTALTCLCGTADAQPQGPGQPSALQGFSKNRGQPIQIESASLEVREKDKQATFVDNVRVVQGDTTLECKTLVVHYDEDQPKGQSKKQGPAAATGGGQQIKKLEAKGGVVVTQKDQTATGDRGVYDVKANTVTLLGNVVVTQGQNVVRGDRVVVEMDTGISRVESSTGSTGRVHGLFTPQARETPKPGGAAAASASSPLPPPPRAASTGEKTKPAAKPKT